MSELKNLNILIASQGQLSGDGQLRESFSERRERRGEEFPMWYLSPSLVQKFNLSEKHMEAVVAEDSSTIAWLKLRFGGDRQQAEFDVEQLRAEASALPPAPKNRDIRLKKF